jgi:hypothetical protein
MTDVKRLKYFNHQFLNEKDFQDEQSYHVEMRRLHNRSLHKWGVVEGLTVERKGDREVIIRPGIAIDREGREIVLPSEIERDIGPSEGSPHVFITISYHETHREDDRQSASEPDSYRRVTEFPEIHAHRQAPAEENAALILARILVDGSGKIHEIDSWGRERAGSAILPGTVGTVELAEDSVTEEKLAPGSVTEEALAPSLRGSLGARGWLRVPFKPVRLLATRPAPNVRVRVLENEAEEFISEVAYSWCGQRGARGTMAIPVPPGATKVSAFRLAGSTKRGLMAQLMRTGWNHKENRGESTELVNEIMEDEVFNRHKVIEDHLRHLDPQFHALALSVIADAEAEIWLAAVEFE